MYKTSSFLFHDRKYTLIKHFFLDLFYMFEKLLVHKLLLQLSYLAFPNLPGVPPVFFFFIADPLTSGLSTYEKQKR